MADDAVSGHHRVVNRIKEVGGEMVRGVGIRGHTIVKVGISRQREDRGL